MPRIYRFKQPNAIFHIFNRGVDRQSIFFEPKDYQIFLKVLEKAAKKFDLSVFAYALMTNHYHLLIRDTNGYLSEAMKFLGYSFVKRINLKYGRDGPLFKGRFSSRIVESDEYLLQLIAYIHLNPVKALLASEPEDYEWSSAKSFEGLMRGEHRLLDFASLRLLGVNSKTLRAKLDLELEKEWDSQQGEAFLKKRIIGDSEFGALLYRQHFQCETEE